MMCNCHHEAGTESYQGKVAVNRVVMTRVRMGSYPNTVCGVIWQRAQFSWTLFRRHRNQPVSGQSYRNCYNAVQEAHQFNGHFASHYHANYVRPSWRRGCRGRFTIGVHHFYRSCGVQAPASPAGGGSEAVALLMTPEEGGHFAICHL